MNRDIPRGIEVENAAAILDVARHLALSCDLEVLLDLIIKETINVLSCERASLFLYDYVADELFTKIATGSGKITVPMGVGIVGACASSGKLLNVPDAYADERFHRKVDMESGFKTRNLLCSPLVGYNGEFVGVLQAINKIGYAFGPADEWLIETLGAQAAVALQRAKLLKEYAEKQRLERELDLAKEIQMSLLPKNNPIIDGYDIAGWNRPADQTGGDCFDFICEDDKRLGIILADASGHGIAPALIVSQVRTILRSLFGTEMSLEDTLRVVNNILCNDLPPDRFITTFCGVLFAKENEIRYCSAGQGPLLHIKPKTKQVSIFQATCCPLGIIENMPFNIDTPIKLDKGDIVLLITDGFFEWMNPDKDQFGIERVSEVILNSHLLPAGEILDKLLAEVERFAKGTKQDDDLTGIVIKREDG